MADTGRKEKPREFQRLLRTAHLLLNSLVIIDGSLGGDELIGPAVPENRFAASVPEGRQIWIIRSEDDPILLHRLIPVTFISGTCDGCAVKLWILREEVSKPIL